MLKIVKLTSLDNELRPEALRAIEEIFFLSTSIKSFSSPEKKEAFFKKWCGDYLEYYPESFYLLYFENRLMGYLSGCDNSLDSLKNLNVPGHSTFVDLFKVFPAHLHINFHPNARGKGWGSHLVRHYLDDLRLKKIPGIHLVTSKDAQNVNFYDRLGFTQTEVRKFNENELYFMGHILE